MSRSPRSHPALKVCDSKMHALNFLKLKMNSYFIYESSSCKYLKSNDTSVWVMLFCLQTRCGWCTCGSAGSLWLLPSSRRAWNPQVSRAGLGRTFLLGQRWKKTFNLFLILWYIYVFSPMQVGRLPAIILNFWLKMSSRYEMHNSIIRVTEGYAMKRTVPRHCC